MPPRDSPGIDEFHDCGEVLTFSYPVIHALMRMNPHTPYPFRAEDVALLHRYRSGLQGIWYRLRDGRVFDKDGLPSEPADPAWYRAEVH